jgi:hypothetical protein
LRAFLEIQNHKSKFKIVTEQQTMFDRKEIYMLKGADSCYSVCTLYGAETAQPIK